MNSIILIAAIYSVIFNSSCMLLQFFYCLILILYLLCWLLYATNTIIIIIIIIIYWVTCYRQDKCQLVGMLHKLQVIMGENSLSCNLHFTLVYVTPSCVLYRYFVPSAPSSPLSQTWLPLFFLSSFPSLSLASRLNGESNFSCNTPVTLDFYCPRYLRLTYAFSHRTSCVDVCVQHVWTDE